MWLSIPYNLNELRLRQSHRNPKPYGVQKAGYTHAKRNLTFETITDRGQFSGFHTFFVDVKSFALWTRVRLLFATASKGQY